MNEINYENVTIKEEQQANLEKDFAIARSVTLPILLFRTAKKYNISLSDAIREGIYLMLQTNDDFLDSDDRYEETLKQKGIYSTKRNAFVSTISKLTGAK